MNTYTNHVLDALETVTTWDLTDEILADAINAQAGLLAGDDPEDTWLEQFDGP